MPERLEGSIGYLHHIADHCKHRCSANMGTRKLIITGLMPDHVSGNKRPKLGEVIGLNCVKVGVYRINSRHIKVLLLYSFHAYALCYT